MFQHLFPMPKSTAEVPSMKARVNHSYDVKDLKNFCILSLIFTPEPNCNTTEDIYSSKQFNLEV